MMYCMSGVVVRYVVFVCFFELHWCEDSLSVREHGVHSELHRLLSTDRCGFFSRSLEL
jgi:hypothetical protein